jgi:hypothetical protein
VINSQTSRTELKQGAKPFCSSAYRIPHHVIDIAQQEVEELCRFGVLQKEIYFEWIAQCLLISKKRGDVCFLTDLRQLNKCPVQIFPAILTFHRICTVSCLNVILQLMAFKEMLI